MQKNAISVLKISLIWQSVLIFLQFIHQGSLGFWILGERALDTTTAQIAHSNFFGWQFLRPYGTFPHPNVAAAYLVISTIILAPTPSRVILNPALRGEGSRFFTIVQNDLGRVLVVTTVPLAILLTFSKSAVFILTASVLASIQNVKRFLVLSIITLILGIFASIQILNSQIASLSERLLLIKSALDISTKNPFFGVGSNNFILELSKQDLTSLAQTRLLQPVHNVFLLILAENGIVGLLLFAILLWSVAQNIRGKIKFLLFAALLFYLSVDHFLWTLQQGQLIFWLIVTYIISPGQHNKTI